MNKKIKLLKDRIDAGLDSVIRSSDITPALREVMHYGTLNGGKRFRPFLMHAWGHVYGVCDDQLDPLMLAVELIHSYSLIHDDLPVMDNSPLRRGQPTPHIKYTECAALLAGSALYALGLDQVINAAFEADIKLKLLSSLVDASGGKGLIGGQMLDTLYEKEHRSITVRDIENMQYLKTGRLIAWSCLAPAIIAGASTSNQQLIQDFAHDLGLLYQLTDDLLDLTGQESEMGKPICQDLENDKINTISLLGVQGTQQKVKQLYKDAQQKLTQFNNNEILTEMLHYITYRKN